MKETYVIYHRHYGNVQIGYHQDKILSVKLLSNHINPHCEENACRLTGLVMKQLDEYFSGQRVNFEIPCEPTGTEFQKKVWHALEKIPYGETRTYKDIAVAIGKPKAYRAVGMANHRNPIQIIIPCHRVIGSNGNLVGYANGLETKQNLLTLERLHHSL